MKLKTVTAGQSVNMTNDDKNLETYWKGTKNKFIRWYFYLNTGLQLVNDFKYVLAFIFGIYLMFKFTNPGWMVAMFLIICPMLILIGWVKVNHVSKPLDWYGTQFASHWSKYGYTLQENILKNLEEINEKLKK